MAEPTLLKQLPAGVIRTTFGNNRCVILINSKMPFAKNTENMKMAAKLLPSDVNKIYWLFSFLNNKHDYNLTTNSYIVNINLPGNTIAEAFDDYEQVDLKYEKYALSECGKKVKVKHDGLNKIGKED